MLITLSEFSKAPDKYMKLAATEDIYITQRGNIVAKLKPGKPEKNKADSSMLSRFFSGFRPDGSKKKS